MDYEFPDGLKYATTHEWIRIENSIATVGITDYAQHQ
ncbi:MAG: glycine cleavage system protein H, partial [Candidatus Lokiarchaeota archaeon]|nr:glycine cleavage system protein H [Candidatus Lokiarchaeota archaeon]